MDFMDFVKPVASVGGRPGSLKPLVAGGESDFQTVVQLQARRLGVIQIASDALGFGGVLLRARGRASQQSRSQLVTFQFGEMCMPFLSLSEPLGGSLVGWSGLSKAQKILCVYGVLMAMLLLPTFALSWLDARMLREVGIWAKPMKFMAGTALFALTTVWLTLLVPGKVGQGQSFQWIAALIIVTSLFEVVYITYQASLGEGSHYNMTDPVRAILFGLMGVAAVGLVASQAWLAWVIWKALGTAVLTPTLLAVLVGLALTFVLSTVSGFMLGGRQPPAGVGWPVVGWHVWQDLRPAHFLAVHAQQFIPLAGIFAERVAAQAAKPVVLTFTSAYIAAWFVLSWMGLVA
jgi:hypothetical protein